MRKSSMGKGASLLISFGICFLFFLVSCGGSDVTTSPFAEFLAPLAEFSASPTTGDAPLTVDFSDQSTGGNVTLWFWDFGDGGTSAEQNPSHDYVTPGTYTVSLTVTGPSGSDTNTKVDHINVTSLVFTDDFNRADSSSPGSNWTVVTGTANIVSNQLMPSTYNTKLHWNAGSSDPDQYSQAKQHGTDWRAVTVRGSGVGANYLAYAAWISGSSGSVSLRIGYTIGTDWGAYLDAGTTTLTWTDGDVLRLEATGQDTNIVLQVYQNSILRKTLVYADFSDPSRVFNSGQPGLFTLNASSAIHDDWEGGGL